MKKRLLVGLVTGLFLAGMVGVASADWIEIPDAGDYGYFLDNVTGYTWMDTDSITNMTPQEMQDLLSGTGFQLATNSQIVEMSNDRGSTDWYADDFGGQIIGTTTSNATWGYSFESLSDSGPQYSVSLVWENGTVQESSQRNAPGSYIGIWAVNTDSAPVPEPATMLLFGTGLAGLVGLRRRDNKK